MKSNKPPRAPDIKTQQSKNSRLASSNNEPLTAGTVNKPSFSHHINQDSAENMPIMIASDEESDRYSEIEEIDPNVEDDAEKIVPEEIAQRVCTILEGKGFELCGWGSTSDYNKMII